MMTVTKKGCLGCSWKTIEQKQFKPENSKCHQQTETRLFLPCSACNSILCAKCVGVFLEKVGSNPNRYHDDCIPVLNGLRTFNDSKGKIIPKYIGHCCFIKGFQKIEIQEEEKTRRKKRKNYSSPNLLGGSFVNPEFKLIVPTCFDSIDVLGQGNKIGVEKDDPELPGRWHYVLDEEDAERITSMGIHPRTDQPKQWDVEKKTIYVLEPHKRKNAKATKFIAVTYYVQQCDFPVIDKGSDQINPNEVSDHYLFQVPNDDRDISIIVGYNKHLTLASLLLMRLHKLDRELKSPHSLLTELSRKLNHNGIVVWEICVLRRVEEDVEHTQCHTQMFTRSCFSS